MWQKNRRGLKYRGFYMKNDIGGRLFILSGLRKNGNVHSVTAESPEVMKKAGWVKTS